MSTKGVTSSFSLEGDALKAAFGDVKISVPTWSRPRRSFEKVTKYLIHFKLQRASPLTPHPSPSTSSDQAYKTGSEEVSLLSGAAKYSTGTSTLTIKFDLKVAGGGGYGCYGGSDY